MNPLLWIALSLICFAAGEASSKLWADSDRWYWIPIAISMYLLNTGAWLIALKKTNTLASLGSFYNAGTILITLFIGAALFGESLALRQWIGIGFALVACLLLGGRT